MSVAAPDVRMQDLARSPIAAEMSWQVMAPLGEEFLIGDHAVTMYDPTLDRCEAPVGNAIGSSPLAETVLPLDRRVAVRLTFAEDDDWVDEVVSPDLAHEINLRTYVWAEKEIYGSSQARVVGVREIARRDPQAVIRFTPRYGGLVMEHDYPTVGGSHRRNAVVYRRPVDP
jgi:hypothetical protein